MLRLARGLSSQLRLTDPHSGPAVPKQDPQGVEALQALPYEVPHARQGQTAGGSLWARIYNGTSARLG